MATKATKASKPEKEEKKGLDSVPQGTDNQADPVTIQVTIQEENTQPTDETVDTTEVQVVDPVVETPKEEKKATKASKEEVKKSLYYRNILIISEVEDVTNFGHQYKRFTTEDKSTLMLSLEEFTNEVTEK